MLCKREMVPKILTISSVTILLLVTTTQGVSLQLHVTRTGGGGGGGGEVGGGPEVQVSWVLSPPPPSLTLTWAAITYASQISIEELGRRLLDDNNNGETHNNNGEAHNNNGEAHNKFIISEGLQLDQQYRFCLTWQPDPSCLSSLPHPRLCSYLTIPSLPIDLEAARARYGPPLYLVLGPVNGKNLSVTWGELPLPRDLPHPLPQYPHHQITRGYRVTWRRVDGQVSHPGHSSNLASKRHLIRGLIPGTRYEVCVGETLANDGDLTCDVINTQEDVPGPPTTEGAWCWSQAHGTHWRCDVTWGPPIQPRGTITGFRIEFRDREGYTLQESLPRGTLCRPLCHHSATAAFHPSTACVIANTAAGEGWESCVEIQDMRARVLSYLELRILVVVGVTVMVYRFGPTILRAVLRCCIRGLYRHLEGGGEKAHPV